MNEIARIEDELERALQALSVIDTDDKLELAVALGLVTILEDRLQRATRDTLPLAVNVPI